MIKQEALEAFEERMGVEFNDRNLLIQAITHRSYLNEHPEHPTGHYERLEFLGDAVLELLVTEHLYRSYPEASEGDLTNKRSALVETANLAEIGKELKLEALLLMGKGERKNVKGFEKTLRYFMSCCVEALFGAMYLEKGFGACRLFADAFVLKRMTRVFDARRDYKSELQDFAQAEFSVTPQYKVIEESGPDHDKHFRVACIMEGKRIGVGMGTNKKEAQVAAAQVALESLNENGFQTDAEASDSIPEVPQRPEPEVTVLKRRQPSEENEQVSHTPSATATHPSTNTEKENNMERSTDQEFVEYIVCAMVRHPEDVRTERTIDEKGVLIVLHVNPNDMSFVLGRSGRNADALRVLIKAMGARRESAVSLKIHESEEDFDRHRGRSSVKHTGAED